MKYGILIRLILTDNIQDKLRLFTSLSLFFCFLLRVRIKSGRFVKWESKQIIEIYYTCTKNIYSYILN